MDWFAPCPWCGTVAWAASPSSVIRPSDQCVSGGRKNSAHRSVTGTAVTISTTGAAQSSKPSSCRPSSTGTTQPFSDHGSRSRRTRKKFWSPLPIG